MRDIKFRGKIKDNGQWAEGYFYKKDAPIQCFKSDEEEVEPCFIIFSGFADWNMPRPMYQVEVLPETVGQYIGLKDKNGKEIYEGDIVKAWSEGYCGKFRIKWRGDGGGTPSFILYPAWQNKEIWCISSSIASDGQCYDRGLEVIGNIYENPELLEEV